MLYNRTANTQYDLKMKYRSIMLNVYNVRRMACNFSQFISWFEKCQVYMLM